MERPLITFDKGTTCSAWNYCGQRLATGSTDGTLAFFDTGSQASSSAFTCTTRSMVHKSCVVKIIWAPPEYGDAIACIYQDGSFSLLEEVVEDQQPLQLKLCKQFHCKRGAVLDIQFGHSQKSLKMVAAFADGHVKVYELLDPLELKNWHIQAEFQNTIDLVPTFGKASCSSASISWNRSRIGSGQASGSFVLGYNSETPQLNSSKVWEFDEARQRWLPIAELGEKDDAVYAVAWAPNIGREYEVIAVATAKGIAIWHVGSKPNMDGWLSTEQVALLCDPDLEVWEMEWDMSGMTLASCGGREACLWQSNLKGVWRKQVAFQPSSG